MHSHNIARALGDVRVADLQRAAPHTTATVPPRRHRRTLALLGLAATAVLTALAPTGAFARPVGDAATPANPHVDGAPARKPVQDPRVLAGISSLAATTATDPDVSTSRADGLRPEAQLQTRPAPTDGIDWADAGIGAGGLLGISLLALGGTLFITHRKRAARDTVAPAAH